MKIEFPFLTTPRWAIERLEKWGLDSPLFQSRVLAQFPTKSNDTIISLADLELCKMIESTIKSRKILGVDIARFGNDFTCILGYYNGYQIFKEKFSGQDLVKTANFIKHKIITEGYSCIVIDDTGLGGGVTDQLNEFCYANQIHNKVEIIAVNFAQSAISQEYEGIVTEMYFYAKNLIENKQINLIDEGDLFSELSRRKYKFTNKGKIRIEAKDEFKKRTGLSSPDEADAFVLACWGMRQYQVVGTMDWGEERATARMDW
jgi:hypothetical protein